jgi:hypothetical protein
MMIANELKNLPPGVTVGSNQMMMGGAADDAAYKPKPSDPAAIAVAAMLGSPQFQKR